MFGSSLFIFDLYEIYALFYTYIIRIYLRMLVSSTISLLKTTHPLAVLLECKTINYKRTKISKGRSNMCTSMNCHIGQVNV